MAKTPFTDPFYIGPICGDTSGYVPVEEKILSSSIFPSVKDLTTLEILDEIDDILSSVSFATDFISLTDSDTADLPLLNIPLSSALEGKSDVSHTHTNAEVNTSIAENPSATRTAAGLGSISTFEGDQNLRTTDPANFASVTTPGTATAANFVDELTSLGNVTTTETLGSTGRNSATLTGATVFTMPDPTVIASTMLFMTQDATGGRAATFTGVLWPNGTEPDFTTSAAAQVDVITFVSDGTSWFGMSVEEFS